LPSRQPRGDEFTTTDFPEAVEMARTILSAPDSEIGLREQLRDRPAWAVPRDTPKTSLRP
jgi:hypothetical protein